MPDTDLRMWRNPTRWMIGLVAAALVVTACAAPAGSASSESDTPVVSTSPSLSGTPCGSTPTISVEEPTTRQLSVDGRDREYRLSLPASYDGSAPAPVIVFLHGADETSSTVASATGLERAAWAAGFMVVAPDAAGGVWMFEDDSDIAYLAELLDELAAELCLDPARIFAAGFSQGGDFASFFACRQPGRFAAIASVAVVNFYEGCSTWSAVPVVAFAGSNDPIYRPDLGLSDAVPFSGDPADKPGPLVDEAGAWAAANGCESVPAESPGPAGVAAFTFGCPDGDDVAYLLHDGGHVWPGAAAPSPDLGPGVPDLDANAIILDFFGEHAS